MFLKASKYFRGLRSPNLSGLLLNTFKANSHSYEKILVRLNRNAALSSEKNQVPKPNDSLKVTSTLDFSKQGQDISTVGVQKNQNDTKKPPNYNNDSYTTKTSNNSSFSHPVSRNFVSAHVISSFLSNVGQQPVQNAEKYFLVKCPNCHNDSSVSSSKTVIKTGSGSLYCTACTYKSSWEQFMDKTLSTKSTQLMIPSGLDNLGRRCVQALTSYIHEPLDNFPRVLSLLSKPKGLFTKETLDAYWLSAHWVEPPTIPSNDPTPPKPQLAVAFPRTSLDPNSDAEFRIVSFKSLSFPGSSLISFEPSTKLEAGLFGYHMIPYDCDTIALTPRELDAMSIYQETGIPSVCLPKSINQLSIDNMPLLARFKKIYLWFDGDVQGQHVAQQLARKLGLDRCYIVKSETASGDPIRNAYDALSKRYDLSSMLENSKLFTHAKVLNFESLKDSVMLEIMNSEQVMGTPSKDFPGLNAIIKGLRPGELTIFTGPTGTGKTTFLSQLSLDFAQSGVSTLWGSFEIANTRLAKRMMFQYIGKSIDGDMEEFSYWSDKFSQLPLYFMKFFGTTRASEVIEAMEHAIFAHDVQHILIDNLQFMSSGLGRGFERYEVQDEALSMFRKFATEHNVHVTLVVHPRKDSRALLELDSVLGSAKMTQEADNVIILQSGPQQSRLIDIKKNRFDGAVGTVPIRFDRDTFRSFELSDAEARELGLIEDGRSQ